ncbi:Rv3235 family protein [Kribbella sp. NPDC026596]|uniref:Rv3235 family protein n=1 Tax=Kribbella sp. NPDC026596 TaxID=3155122 RepID=UPI00340AF15E
MSQPQNLRADELQHPTPLSTLAAVPQAAASDDVVGMVSVATPRLRAVGGRSAGTGAERGAGSVAGRGVGSVAERGAGSVAGPGVGSVAERGAGSVAGPGVGSVAERGAGSVAERRAGSVAGPGVGPAAERGFGPGVGSGVEHRVPATVRYAESMTEGALALRLQAITRLGVVSAPTTLTSLAAFTSAPAQAPAVVGGADEQAAVRGVVNAQGEPAPAAAAAASVAEARKLAAVPAGDAVADGAGAATSGSAESGGSAVERVLVAVPERGASAGGAVGRASAGAGSACEGSASADSAGAGSAGAGSVGAGAVGAGSAGAGSAGAGSAGRAAGVGSGVPEAGAWASRLVQAVSEVLAGDRPISQLVRFTDDAVFTELNRRVRMLGLTTTATTRGAKERSAVRSVRVCAPTEHVAEVAAHVRHGDRSRAIALRMEIRRNRWVCTALELG